MAKVRCCCRNNNDVVVGFEILHDDVFDNVVLLDFSNHREATVAARRDVRIVDTRDAMIDVMTMMTEGWFVCAG